MSKNLPPPIPPPDGGSGEPPDWADDSLAAAEVSKWTNEDDLQGRRNKNEMWVLWTIGLMLPLLIVFFVLVFIASLGVWVWHYITPYPFLCPDQLSKIQSVIFSGTLGAVATSMGSRYLSKKL